MITPVQPSAATALPSQGTARPDATSRAGAPRRAAALAGPPPFADPPSPLTDAAAITAAAVAGSVGLLGVRRALRRPGASSRTAATRVM